MNKVSFASILKGIGKRWMILGLVTILFVLLGSVYAVIFMPLSTDLYKQEFYLIPRSTQTAAGAVIDDSPQLVEELTVSYFTGDQFMDEIFQKVKDTVFRDTDEDKRLAEFRRKVSIVYKEAKRGDIFAVNLSESQATQVFGEARVLLDSWVEKLNGFYDSGDDTKKPMEINWADEATNALKLNITAPGFITARERAYVIIITGVVGFVISVIVAVCLYFFNNRVNSVNMLNYNGIPVLALDNGDMDKFYSENALKLKYLLKNAADAASKAEGEGAPEYDETACKIVAYTSLKPQLAEGHMREQAVALRKWGYKVCELTQGSENVVEFKQKLAESMGDNDYVLIDAKCGCSYEVTIAAEEAQGTIICIDQRNDKYKDVKQMNNILGTAGAVMLGAIVTNTTKDFVI